MIRALALALCLIATPVLQALEIGPGTQVYFSPTARPFEILLNADGSGQITTESGISEVKWRQEFFALVLDIQGDLRGKFVTKQLPAPTFPFFLGVEEPEVTSSRWQTLSLWEVLWDRKAKLNSEDILKDFGDRTQTVQAQSEATGTFAKSFENLTIEIKAGDEVVLPSFNYNSTVIAVQLNEDGTLTIKQTSTKEPVIPVKWELSKDQKLLTLQLNNGKSALLAAPFTIPNGLNLVGHLLNEGKVERLVSGPLTKIDNDLKFTEDVYKHPLKYADDAANLAAGNLSAVVFYNEDSAQAFHRWLFWDHAYFQSSLPSQRSITSDGKLNFLTPDMSHRRYFWNFHSWKEFYEICANKKAACWPSSNKRLQLIGQYKSTSGSIVGPMSVLETLSKYPHSDDAKVAPVATEWLQLKYYLRGDDVKISKDQAY